MIERSRVRSTISSRCAAIGTTTPSRARFTSSDGHARERGGDACDLVGDLVDGREVEIVAEPRRELGRDPPVVHRGALGRDLAPDALHAAFEIGDRAGLLAPERAREEHVGALRRLGVEPVDHDDRVDRVERAPGERGVGEVADGVGAEQDQDADLAVGRGAQDALGVEPRFGRHRTPLVGEPFAARVERRAPGQEPGREPGVERAVHVAAPQRRQERNVVHPRQLGRGADDRIGGGGEVAAARRSRRRDRCGPR